ncbi:MAG TPA: hypothetical protein VFY83_05000 [Anaerolineales bacterium]|nr:hypothetical protein [Anaerolineales bacterium]
MDQTNNTQEPYRTNKPSQFSYYEIRVQGQLDSNWSDWFNGLDVMPQENGETLIAGSLQDQAALQGILTKIFNLHLVLLSVRRTDPGT